MEKKLAELALLTGEHFKRTNFEVVVLKVLVLVMFVWLLVLSGCVWGIKNMQDDVITTPTVSHEIKQVWELQEVPTGELK